jgi:hypothetical protein
MSSFAFQATSFTLNQIQIQPNYYRHLEYVCIYELAHPSLVMMVIKLANFVFRQNWKYWYDSLPMLQNKQSPFPELETSPQ